MDAPTVAASLSVVAAVVAAIAAWKSYGLSRSVARRGIEAERAALAREWIETTRTIQTESLRALALCYRRRALLNVAAKEAGIHSSSGHVEGFGEADLYGARILEIRGQAAIVTDAVAATLTTEDLSHRLPYQQANLTDLRKIIADVTVDCDKATGTFDSLREMKERDFDRMLRPNTSPVARSQLGAVWSFLGSGMPWHRVVIRSSDVVSETVVGLFGKFETAYRNVGSPPDASVFRGRSADGDHVFYFSPVASSFAGQLLREFAATACPEAPDLTGFVTVHL